jgi:hydrogenase maturation protease
MEARGCRVLVYGYGNPGRGDDGLGPALAAALEQSAPASATIESNYQLSVEDSAEVAEHDAVIFVDADTSGPGPFRFERVKPEKALSFSSHSVAPGALLALSEELFKKTVAGYILGIRGYEFNEFNESLSRLAQENLGEALRFVTRALEEQRFDQYLQRYAIGSGQPVLAEAQ